MAIENLRIAQGSDHLVEQVFAMEKFMPHHSIDSAHLRDTYTPDEKGLRVLADLSLAYLIYCPEQDRNIDYPNEVERSQKSLVFF